MKISKTVKKRSRQRREGREPPIEGAKEAELQE